MLLILGCLGLALMPRGAFAEPAAQEPAKEVTRFGIYAWLPRALTENRREPLKIYLERTLPFPIEHAIIVDRGEYEHRIESGDLEIAFQDGCQTIEAVDSGIVTPIVEAVLGPSHVLVVTSAKSEIQTLQGLRGKSIALAGQTTASSVSRIGLFTISDGGGPLEGPELDLSYSRDHAETIFAVLSGKVDAGIVLEIAYSHLAPELKEELRVLAKSSIPISSFLVGHASVPSEKIELLRRAFLDFENDPLGVKYFSQSLVQGFAAIDPERMAFFRETCARIDGISSGAGKPEGRDR